MSASIALRSRRLVSPADGIVALASILVGVLMPGCAKSTAEGKVKPETALALRKQMARSLVAHGEYVAASQPLLEIKDSYPNDPELHTLLGTAYREQGLFEAAEGEFRTALKLDPKAAEAWDGLGILREVRGDDGDAALEDFKTSIRHNPERAATYNNLGFALYIRGRYEEAVTAYRQGLRRDPATRRMRNNLGFAYSRLGHPHRAMREFERGGSKAEAQNNMGFAYEQAKELPSACECYREAIALDPNLDAAQVNFKRACPALAAAASAATTTTTSGDAVVPADVLSQLPQAADPHSGSSSSSNPAPESKGTAPRRQP